MNKVLIAPITDAANSDGFWVEDGHMATVVLHSASALLDTEFADIQISSGDGVWQDVYIEEDQKRLYGANNVVTIVGPGLFRVAKEATVAAVGVYAAMRD